MPSPLINRYHRQMLLPGIGEAGQRSLAASHAAIIGCGALGCTIADFLARAGVGTLTIIDRDVVEPTNLQRQCLYDERDAAEGTPKAEAAARRLAAINSGIRLNPIVADFHAASAHRLLSPLWAHDGATALVDGTDNFDTRYLINDIAVKHALPYIYGGAVATRGMQFTVRPGITPCLRCLFPEPPAPGTQPTCDTAGVLGPAVAAVAARQATDAIKLFTGHGDLIAPVLMEFDAWADTSRRVDLGGPSPECACCAARRFDFLDAARGVRAQWMCGQNSVQIFPDRSAMPSGDDDEGAEDLVDLPALAERLRPHGEVSITRFMTRVQLRAVAGDDGGPVHLSIFPDGRALVRGLRDPRAARALYDRFIGA